MKEKYKATAKTILGIRVGDEVEYDTEKKTSILLRTKKILPFDVRKETTFFEMVPPTPISLFKSGDVVHFSTVNKLEIVGGKGFKRAGKFFNIGAFVSLKIVSVNNIPYLTRTRIRKGEKNYFYIAEIGDFQYKIEGIKENVMALTAYYWFISSKGKVSQDIIGKDLDAEKFRTKQKNYFATSAEAKTALAKL